MAEFAGEVYDMLEDVLVLKGGLELVRFKTSVAYCIAPSRPVAAQPLVFADAGDRGEPFASQRLAAVFGGAPPDLRQDLFSFQHAPRIRTSLRMVARTCDGCSLTARRYASSPSPINRRRSAPSGGSHAATGPAIVSAHRHAARHDEPASHHPLYDGANTPQAVRQPREVTDVHGGEHVDDSLSTVHARRMYHQDDLDQLQEKENVIAAGFRPNGPRTSRARTTSGRRD